MRVKPAARAPEIDTSIREARRTAISRYTHPNDMNGLTGIPHYSVPPISTFLHSQNPGISRAYQACPLDPRGSRAIRQTHKPVLHPHASPAAREHTAGMKTREHAVPAYRRGGFPS